MAKTGNKSWRNAIEMERESYRSKYGTEMERESYRSIKERQSPDRLSPGK